MQIRCGCIWKQLSASMADSQSTISREPGTPLQKYPQSLLVPGAIPRQTRGPVPRSSAPTGRLALPATNTKTALPRRSAYNLPEAISGSISAAARQRRCVRYWRTRLNRRSSRTGRRHSQADPLRRPAARVPRRARPAPSEDEGSLLEACAAEPPAATWPAARCSSSQTSATWKSTWARCITRSIAPPPPWPVCQFMNLAPVTDNEPRSVCHLRRSCPSRAAPRKISTLSNGAARTTAARRRRSTKLTPLRFPRPRPA